MGKFDMPMLWYSMQEGSLYNGKVVERPFSFILDAHAMLGKEYHIKPCPSSSLSSFWAQELSRYLAYPAVAAYPLGPAFPPSSP